MQFREPAAQNWTSTQLQNVIKLEPDYSLAHIFLGYTYAGEGDVPASHLRVSKGH